MVVYPLSDLAPMSRKADTAALSTEDSLKAAFSRLPLLFIPNQGQLDNRVEYYAKAAAQTLYFTKQSIIFDLTRHNQAAETATAGGQAERLVFSLDFLGANMETAIEGTGKDNSVVNYLIGNDPEKWYTDIPTYREVVYRDIYPAVDLRLFGKGNLLEYDFVVRPGASPNDIALAYNGIDSLTIENGALVAGTAFGDIKQDTPYIYQQIGDRTVNVAGGFKLNGSNTYGFYAAAYDSRYPLIIDPSLIYSTYLGGGVADYGYSIAVDAAGSAYITGETGSTNFPTQNPYQASNAGSWDAFVTKLSPEGNSLAYSTYLGGSGIDEGRGIAVDAAGSAYVIGLSDSTNFPTTAGAFQTANAGSADAFVTKLSPAGNSLAYSTYLGGGGGDLGYGMAVDTDGSAYVTGWTNSGNFPTTPGALQTTLAGISDAFVTKLSPVGSALAYSTYLGGSGSEDGLGIAVDTTDRAYITGDTNSTNFPTTVGAFRTTLAGTTDAFVTKLSPAGSALVYSTYLGGGNEDIGRGIAVDPAGSAYVTGPTHSTNFPTTAGALQTSYAGNGDAFVTRLSAAGNSLGYSTYLGGGGEDIGRGIAVDTAGSAYVTGQTASTNFPIAGGALPTAYAGGSDVFVTKLSAAGSALVYSTYLRGGGDDYGYSIALDSAGGAYITGYTSSTDFPTRNPYQGTKAGGVDVFVAKLTQKLGQTSPTVTTNAATGVGSNSATLNMSYYLAGYSSVEVRFAYKISSASTWTYTSWVSKSADGSYAETVTGLLPGVQYDFKAQLQYLSNIVDGETLQFVTDSASQPHVSPPMPAQLNQAQVYVQYLNVNPGQASANQPVIVTTNVVNTGDQAGSLNVVLKINGQTEQARVVSVGPKATQPVRFTVSRTQPGTYAVNIFDQNGSFTVTGDSSTGGRPVNSGVVILLALVVLVLTAAVLLVLKFRTS